MTKNLIPMIAEQLGVYIGQSFKLEGRAGVYWFTEKGLMWDGGGWEIGSRAANKTLVRLIAGELGEPLPVQYYPKEEI